MGIAVRYPCFASGEPRPMRADAIWSVAENVRGRGSPLLGIGAIMRKSLCVNGRAIRVAWDIDHAVHDASGAEVLGVCEHDPSEAGTVMISLNAEMLAGNAELFRSTAAHELGHAIFDMPAAVGGARHTRIGERRPARASMDWREWRADEFMGALLMPPGLARKALLRHAGTARIPIRWMEAPDGARPEIEGATEAEFLADEIAAEFGVSPVFAGVRLRKYRLVSG